MTAFGTLVAKELRIELRGREMLTGGLLLVLLVLVLANLAWAALGPARALAPGVLWIAIAFAGTLVLNRSVHRERDRGSWEALAALPVDWGLVYLAKTTAHVLVLLALEAAALPLFAVLFDADLLTPLARLAPVLVLATIGFAATGTLFAIASVHGRAREVLLPVLLFPLLVPLLMVAIQATQRVLFDEPLRAVLVELQFLAAYDTIFLALGWLTVDYLLGD